MPLIAWIGVAVASVLAGAAMGWMIVSSIMGRQYKARLHRAIEQMKQQHASTDDKLRAAHTRATMELEQVKASIPRQIGIATAEARARITRLEEQLRHAHSELDRMRPKLPEADRRADAPDGFAATRPFGDTR